MILSFLQALWPDILWPIFGLVIYSVCIWIGFAAFRWKFRGVTPLGIVQSVGMMALGPFSCVVLFIVFFLSFCEGNWGDWWTEPLCKCVPKGKKT